MKRRPSCRATIAIERGAAISLPAQIVGALACAIQEGALRPGDQLPSTRALARELRVSRNTALASYDELVSRGLIFARRGSGMYVQGVATAPALDLGRIMHEAQFPLHTIGLRDQDGNVLCVRYDTYLTVA